MAFDALCRVLSLLVVLSPLGLVFGCGSGGGASNSGGSNSGGSNGGLGSG